MSISALAAIDRTLSPSDPAPPVSRAGEVAELSAESGRKLFGPEGLTFGSILDAINPLQHLPVISTLYRSLTGESISPGSRMIGGALFGGVFGFASAVVNAIVEGDTGKDIGGHVLAWFDGDKAAGETKVAGAAPWVDPDTLPEPIEVAAGPAAKPWVDPDLQPIEAAEAPVAKPWVDPDSLPVQTANAPTPKPWVDPDRRPLRVAETAKPAIAVDRPWFGQVQQPLAAEAARRNAAASSPAPAIASRHPMAMAAQSLLATAEAEAAPRRAEAGQAAGAYSQRAWFPAYPTQVDLRR